MNKESSRVFVYLEVTLMAASLLSPHKERMDLATALVWMSASQCLSPFSYHYSSLKPDSRLAKLAWSCPGSPHLMPLSALPFTRLLLYPIQPSLIYSTKDCPPLFLDLKINNNIYF